MSHCCFGSWSGQCVSSWTCETVWRSLVYKAGGKKKFVCTVYYNIILLNWVTNYIIIYTSFLWVFLYNSKILRRLIALWRYILVLLMDGPLGTKLKTKWQWRKLMKPTLTWWIGLLRMSINVINNANSFLICSHLMFTNKTRINGLGELSMICDCIQIES